MVNRVTESLDRGRRRETPDGSGSSFGSSEPHRDADRSDPRGWDGLPGENPSNPPMSPLSPEEAALLRGAKPEPRPASAEKRPKGPRLSELTETPPPEGARDGALGLVRVEAPTYAEALREIRQRFGDDVSIVHTRVIRRKGMLGVLGATGVEVYVTGRGEYEEWRRHPEAGGGRIPREASRRGEGNLGSPLPEARLPETRRPAALPTAERRAPAPRAKDNPWGIEERREAPAAERRGFDAGRVIAPETRNAPGPVAGQAVGGQAVGGQAVGQHENAAGADTDPDDVVRALERLSKKIGNVMAENGQPVEAPQPLPKGNRPTTAAPTWPASASRRAASTRWWSRRRTRRT